MTTAAWPWFTSKVSPTSTPPSEWVIKFNPSQKKVKEKDSYIKEYKQGNLEEQNFEEQV